MRYAFHPDALVELKETAQHYAERVAGPHIRFVGSVEEAVSRILEQVKVK